VHGRRFIVWVWFLDDGEAQVRIAQFRIQLALDLVFPGLIIQIELASLRHGDAINL